jgi:hypothetical protein
VSRAAEQRPAREPRHRWRRLNDHDGPWLWRGALDPPKHHGLVDRRRPVVVHRLELLNCWVDDAREVIGVVRDRRPGRLAKHLRRAPISAPKRQAHPVRAAARVLGDLGRQAVALAVDHRRRLRAQPHPEVNSNRADELGRSGRHAPHFESVPLPRPRARVVLLPDPRSRRDVAAINARVLVRRRRKSRPLLFDRAEQHRWGQRDRGEGAAAEHEGRSSSHCRHEGRPARISRASDVGRDGRGSRVRNSPLRP